jgi:molecular chaperone GrpE
VTEEPTGMGDERADETGVEATAEAVETQTSAETTPEAAEGEQEEEKDELASLREQFELAQAQADEYLDDLRRERAAFQNYKRRQEAERGELRQMAVGGLVLQILPIIDDLERALRAVPEEQCDEPWIEGIKLIQRKLLTTLESVGVVPVEAEPGQPFDPFMHEAVSYEEHEDHQESEIIAVVDKGYMLGQRTLRPARVRVAK